MKKLMLATLAVALSAPFAVVMPAHAQLRDRALVIYGNDACPADTICVTKPESERFRIPEELRETKKTQADVAWGERVAQTQDVGRTGTMSCSAIGAGGWTGCYQKMLDQAAAEKRQAANGEAPDQ